MEYSDEPSGGHATAAHLLVVDDEPAQLQALSDRLLRAGFRVSTAASGEAALAILAAAPGSIDLLLTDLRMPDIDGLALQERALATDPHLATVLMTGHGSVESAVAALKNGALDYIAKPFRMAEIQPVLARALRTRRLRLRADGLQRSLAQRQSQLEAANRELDAFAARVAHDLRSPVQQMVGFAELLQPHLAPTPEAKRLYDRLQAAGDRAGRLIEDLLRFARLGDSPLQRTRVSLERIVALACAAAENDGRRIKWQLGALPEVQGDEALLQLVFANLIGNAVKYTATRESPSIEIGGRLENGRALVWVRDNGVGFDPAQAHRLFGAFERLHSQREFPGTGMGLANVRRIVERHGGSVRAEGEPGVGACFTLELPAAGPGG